MYAAPGYQGLSLTRASAPFADGDGRKRLALYRLATVLNAAGTNYLLARFSAMPAASGTLYVSCW